MSRRIKLLALARLLCGAAVLSALPAGVDPKNLSVRATLYYQSIPPHYLHDRFTQSPYYPATRRLYYLTSNLRTQGTAMENWKVRVVSAMRVAAQ